MRSPGAQHVYDSLPGHTVRKLPILLEMHPKLRIESLPQGAYYISSVSVCVDDVFRAQSALLPQSYIDGGNA
ncbi:MAG: hypothetical protein JOZ62_17685 [Acidobacteriaceae bacterium]|nr:hypothetical protein [Acidobacteriaceae bacterium]